MPLSFPLRSRLVLWLARWPTLWKGWAKASEMGYRQLAKKSVLFSSASLARSWASLSKPQGRSFPFCPNTLGCWFLCGCLSDGTVPQAQKYSKPTDPPKQLLPQLSASCLCRDSWSLGLGRVVRRWWEKGAPPIFAHLLPPCGLGCKDGCLVG